MMRLVAHLARMLIIWISLFAWPLAIGWSAEHLEDQLPPPPAADLREGQTLEPEITIIEREDGVIEEYRYGGRVYLVKITPRKGVPYYLVDTDGDGELETRRTNLSERLLIPHWILFSW